MKRAIFQCVRHVTKAVTKGQVTLDGLGFKNGNGVLGRASETEREDEIEGDKAGGREGDGMGEHER
eukprot:1322637-Amorphochlora_amoeboformis.AAC.1